MRSTDITRRQFLKTTALAATGALAPTSFPQTPAASRLGNTQRLQDNWEFCHSALGGPWDAWRPDRESNIVWQPVRLPHCFNARDAVDPDEMYYQGPGWYRTKLALANPFPDGRTLLHFEGAGQKSEVFVYLDRVSQHVGGYNEFVVDITEAVAKSLAIPATKGLTPLAVMCDNSRDLQMIPSGLNDFTRFGGLYRHVHLAYVPAISLERVHVDTRVTPGRPATIFVKAKLYNPASLRDQVQILVQFFDPGGSMIYTNSTTRLAWQEEQEIAKYEVAIPQLWSPSLPNLYRCEVTLASRHGEMSLRERLGFRYFEFLDHGPFKLNGERLLLKGTHRAEDHAGVGAAIPDDVTARELKMIKDLGANFVRLGHYQQSRSVLDACDELGLLVWEEIPWSRGGLGGEHYRQQARQMLRDMIGQHYNHPSVLIWGLGNEDDMPGDFPNFDQAEIRAFVKELNDLAHALDPLRKTGLRRCDFCKDIVDVYSPSLWAGWYGGPYTEYKSLLQKEMANVNHMLQIEWGGDSHAGRHSEDVDRFLVKAITGKDKDPRGLNYLLAGGQMHASMEGDWSETYACNLFDWHLKEQETMPWLAGAAQWIFKDFSSPVRGKNPIPHVNEKGLVERDLTPKESYFVFQSYWAEKPMIHIYGHTWPVRWGDPEEQKLVKVYSNCQTVELFLNGTPCGSRSRNSQDFPATGLHWLLNFKEGENHLRAVGSKNGETVRDEIRFQYQTLKWGRPAFFELEKKEQRNDRVTIEARLVDANRVLCLDSRTLVRFGVAGDGMLLDNLGTSRGSRCIEPYNGRAEISLLLNHGKSVVTIASSGLPTALLPVE